MAIDLALQIAFDDELCDFLKHLDEQYDSTAEDMEELLLYYLR